MSKTFNKYIVGSKVGMSSLFDDNGQVIPVSIIKVNNCVYFDIDKNSESFNRVNVTFGQKKDKLVSKPLLSYYKKQNITSPRYYRTINISKEAFDADVPTPIDPSIFELNESVNVRAKSKGNGFTGTIKKGFKRGLMTHGSKSKRLPGSIGAGTYPGHVLKGTTMGGRTGNKYVTQKNLSVVKVQGDLLFIKGSVPGKDGFVEIFN